MPANYVLLSEQTTNTTVASVTFSNIPQTGYSDLKIVVSARSNAARDDDYATIALNGVTTNQAARVLFGTGSATGSVTGTPVSTPICAANNTANIFGNSEFYIPNYTSNTNKSFTQIGVLENNATWGVQNIGVGQWSPTTPVSITSIVFTSTYGSFVANSSFSLYGIANLGTEPVVGPKASGGDIIVNDGTYWYHTFLSTGTFIPTSPLTCDYLVVAGGGAGGNANNSGGGGAGGLRCTVTATGGGGTLESPLALTAQPYNVIIGAGGAGAALVSDGSVRTGASGSNSVFASITSVGGGGGGSGNPSPTNGLAGGSGGGNPFNLTSAGGARTVNQGFAGGAGQGDTPLYNAGGGGGAGAIGAYAGGNGVATSISGSSVTYAGGGGGATNATTNNAGGTGGGGRGTAPTGGNATSGTINTGSGGGGTGNSGGGPSGSGGSGIVVVRYAMA
jgi:hypothetical protein